MKALVKAQAELGLWLQDVPEPTIGINDVLIRVLRTGICGTDVHIYDWDDWARQTITIPMTIGHEFVGEIVRVGSNVNDFNPGELVSGEGHVVCGRCRHCMAGQRHLCTHTSGVGVNRPGCFAEFLALPMSNVWRHDPNVDRDLGIALVQLADSQPSTKVTFSLAERALPLLESALNRDHNDWPAWEAKGSALWFTGRLEPAAAAYERVLQTVPERETTLSLAANLALRMGRLEVARSRAERRWRATRRWMRRHR